MSTRIRPPMVQQNLINSCWAAVLESWSRVDARVGGGALRQQELITRWGEGPTGGITPATKIPVIAAALGLQMPQARFRYVTAFLESTLRTSHVFCVYFDSHSGFMHTVLSTQQAGRELAGVIKPGALIISFQNGIHNAEVLQELLRHRVLRGMVPFNVVPDGEGVPSGRGRLAGGRGRSHAGRMGTKLRSGRAAAGPAKGHAVGDVGQDAHESEQRHRRPGGSAHPVRAVAACLSAMFGVGAGRRARAVATAAGIQRARLTQVPPAWAPRLLCVPDWLFKVLAKKLLAIDPTARSSMSQDLHLGRIHGSGLAQW